MHKKKLIDYIFWIFLILFTNPGGVLVALGENPESSGVNATDILFFGCTTCYLAILRSNNFYRHKIFLKFLKFLLIVLLYHFTIFTFFVPGFKGTDSMSPLQVMIKNRHVIISFMMFIYVYFFFIRSYQIFFKIFIYSSTVIMVLFLFSWLTGLELLPIVRLPRKFISIERIFMFNYGMLPILLPLGIIVMVFKFEIKYRNLVLLASVLMFTLWLISITRRHILGAFIYYIISLLLLSYFESKKNVIVYKAIKSLLVIFVFSIAVQYTFPNYYNSTVEAVNEAVYIIEHGETSQGNKDARLGFGKEFMQRLIKENYLVGTGFDNRWRTKEGDELGYEAADYPLLAAIAMKGVLGLLFFLPVYFNLIKTLLRDSLFIRKNYKIINKGSLHFMLLTLFLIYFYYEFLQYVNWFSPISLPENSIWYMYLGMYLASRKCFYYEYSMITSK